jgi:hypothetical protein
MTDNPNQKQGSHDDPRNLEKQREEERRKQQQGQQQNQEKFPSRGEHEGATDDEMEKKDQGQRRAS